MPVELPGEGLNDTFNIRNDKYGEFMCASSTHLDVFKSRRIINTLKSSNSFETDKKCVWKLEQLESETRDFIVWNLEYSEPLYASHDIYKTVKSRRNVYTWYSKPDR